MNLLKNPEVVQWLKGDLSFLSRARKKEEDAWGRALLQSYRPDIRVNKQWSGLLGELIVRDLFRLMGCELKRAERREDLLPDFESDDFVIEVKTSTYMTMGTASEKIMGTGFKYAAVPRVYGKPLFIVCLAGAERDACKYGVFGQGCEEKNKQLELWREQKINFVKISKVIEMLEQR
jgi:hypothetical protein